MFIVAIFLAACTMVILMTRPPKFPELIPVDEEKIQKAIEHKDLTGFVSQERISDQEIAEILNRNIVPEEPQTEALDRGTDAHAWSLIIDRTNGRAGLGVSKKKTIAYAITVTKDGSFVDGALVLGRHGATATVSPSPDANTALIGYAAKKIHDASKGFKSDYSAELVAFVTGSVVTSRPILSKFGWRIIEKPLPVSIDEIENKEYATTMKNSGCCGADEFLKLWAYTLTEYHRVVHLDMDSIIFNSMDDLYSIDKEMLFTGDYNMGSKPVPPAQGGFLVIRPSLDRFKEFQDIIRRGDWGNKGWGGSHIGKFWGGQTIQGIVPYFYHSIHPGDAQELNRCVYNCMVDNPYRKGTTICLDQKVTTDLYITW